MVKLLNTFSQNKMYLVASCGDVPFQVELAKKSHQLLLTCIWKLGHLKCYRQTMEGSSRKFCEKLAMEIVRGSPYHPQSKVAPSSTEENIIWHGTSQ